MDENKHPERAVLVYFLFLIVFVISNMMKRVTILDIIYLIALICAVIKYFLIMHKNKKVVK